jgi:sporulation protein YlmC with PRC-barrel domain
MEEEMRKGSIFTVVFVISMFLAFGVYAAGYDKSGTRGEDTSVIGTDMGNGSLSRGAEDMRDGKYSRASEGRRVIDRASKVIGMDVKNPQGVTLGEIKDIAIDERTGLVAYAVLDPSRTVDAGDKFFAIPWKALTFSTTGDNLVLNVDKNKLKNAPGFSKNNWPDFANQQWGAEVYRYYGQQPYWEEHSGGTSSYQRGNSY